MNIKALSDTVILRFFLSLFWISCCLEVSLAYAVPSNIHVDNALSRSPKPSRLVKKPGSNISLQRLNSAPSDLHIGPASQIVRFSVPVVGTDTSTLQVFLRKRGDKQKIPMQLFSSSKTKPATQIWVADVTIDTRKGKPDSCSFYEAYTENGRSLLVSPSAPLCMTSFPVGFAESDFLHPAKFPDGSKAVGDEILLTVSPSITAVALQELAKSIHARIVGGYKSMNYYQLKLSASLDVAKLTEMVSALKKRPGVIRASINPIGGYAYVPNDTDFNLAPTDSNSQHDLKLALAHNQGTGANAWDGNTRGNGVTVVIMDSGLQSSHPDLNPAWTCQTAASATLVPCDDPVGHGTEVAGVVAARTNNGQGVAGVAFESSIHSIQVSATVNVSAPQMLAGFTAARDYVATHPEASVVNASFYAAGASATAADWALICTRIEETVFAGSARAVIVNAVGNNNLNAVIYPARCKDLNAELSHKNLFITVSNSTSTVPDALCGSLGPDLRCSTSNYGAWVDIAAPGSLIRTTTIGSGYNTPTGNSFSAPLVAGAAAMLRSCPNPLAPDLILSTLISSSAVAIPYPAFGANPAGTTPRLDIYRALNMNAPVATNRNAAETYIEDQQKNLTDIVITDPDVCANITATLTVVPASAGTLTGGVTTWTMSGAVANVNAALAALTFTPASNFNSNFNITTSIADGFAAPLTGTKVMTGTPVNDAPSFVAGGDQTVNEDAGAQTVAGFATSISAGPPDEVAQTLTFNTSNTNNALFSAQPAINSSGTLTYTPAPNANGTATVTVVLTDSGGVANGGVDASAPQTFDITVSPVNDAPSFTVGANQTVNEDAGAQTVAGFATSISAGPPDEVAQTLTFNTSNTNNALFSVQPAISSSGTLTYTPAPNANGTATVTVVLTDSGGVANGGVNTSAPQTFDITVSPVNDAPGFVAGANQTVNEDAGAQTVAGFATSISAGPADEVSQTLTFNTSNTNNALFSVQPAISSSGTLTYTPAPNANGTATVTVVLTDSGGVAIGGVDASAPQTFDITVSPVNDAPSGSDVARSMDEDTTYHFIASDFGFSDPLDSPPDSLGAILITTVPPIGALELSGASVTNGQTVPIANLGNLTFRPVGDANGSPYTSFTFQVVDNGGSNGAIGDVNTDSTANTFTFNVNPTDDPLTGPLSIIPPEPVAPNPPRKPTDLPLTLDVSGLADADCPPPLNAPATSGGLCTTGSCDLAYQWTASAASGVPPVLPPTIPNDAIPGANASSYQLTSAEVGLFMGVCVSTGTGAACSQRCTVSESRAIGDPHITTVDGLYYDFQGEGDFVALRGDNGMEIQLRMSAVSTAPPLTDPYSGLAVGVSVNSAVAARVGQRRVSYQPDTSPGAASGTYVLRVDGVVTALTANGIDLGDGGRILPLSGGGIQIDFPDQTTLMVSAPPYTFHNASWLHISVFHTSAYKGIMGARSKGSWLPVLSNGSALGPKPAALHDRYVDLYETFANSWRVTNNLFDSAAATPAGTPAGAKWPMEKGPYVRGNVPVAKPLGLKEAELACKDILGKNEKAACIFDVRVVGDKNIAKGHLQNQKIRLGAVNITVRAADKLNARGETVVTATVARHAMVVPKVKGLRTIPTGMVQFMLGDKTLGKPVQLNAKGQASMVVTRQDMERFKTGKLAITARYLPAKDKANVFLPGVSKRLTPELVPAAVRAGAVVDLPRRLK